MAFSEYTGIAQTVQAEQIDEPRAVITPNGPVTGNEGDWEVRAEDGNVFTLSDDEFQAMFGSEKDKTVKESTTAGTYSGSGADSGVSPDETPGGVKTAVGTPGEESGQDMPTGEHPGQAPADDDTAVAREESPQDSAPENREKTAEKSDDKEDKFPKK